MNEEILLDIRKAINSLLDRVESHDLPLPYSIDPDADLGTIEVAWMLHEDIDGSRKVVNAFPGGEWKQARSFKITGPILESCYDGRNNITLWAHPDAFTFSIKVP